MRFRSYFPSYGVFEFLMLGLMVVAAAFSVFIMGPRRGLRSRDPSARPVYPVVR